MDQCLSSITRIANVMIPTVATVLVSSSRQIYKLYTSHGVLPTFARLNAHRIFYGQHINLAVTAKAGMGGFLDSHDNCLHDFVTAENFESDMRHIILQVVDCAMGR